MFSYDLSSTDAATQRVAQVRLLIADTSALDFDFEDEELSALLGLVANEVKLAAAAALEALAANRSRLAVRMTRGAVTDDLSVVARELRALAAQYREEAKDDLDVPLEAFITPDWEPFIERKNRDLERQDAVREL